MLKKMLGGAAIAAGLLFGGFGCPSVPIEDTTPIPEAAPDPGMGAYNVDIDGGFSGFEGGNGATAWSDVDPNNPDAGADQNGWQLADPTGARLNMPIIYFAYDSDMLVPSETSKLDNIAAYMSDKPELGLVIEGHCDQRGTDEYNRALGERRANAIRAYLNGAGIADGRIRTVSYGKDKPEVEGSGEEIWKQNRRGVPVPMVMN